MTTQERKTPASTHNQQGGEKRTQSQGQTATQTPKSQAVRRLEATPVKELVDVSKPHKPLDAATEEASRDTLNQLKASWQAKTTGNEKPRSRARQQVDAMLADSAALEAAAREDATRQGEEVTEPENRPLRLDPWEFTADTFFDERPPDPELLFDGCTKRSIMALVAPAGAGKSTFCAQLSAQLAAGRTFFGQWTPTEAQRCLFLSLEDDKNVIRQRVHDAMHGTGLPIEQARAAARLVSVPPVKGFVPLFDFNLNGQIIGQKDTVHFEDLKAMIEAFKPGLVILDTLSKFCFGVEGDNTAMNVACGKLEALTEIYDTNFLIIHHIAKGAGGLIAKKDTDLSAMLDAYASRGASALTGSTRWQMNLAPLSQELAVKKIGDAARGKPDGTYVAARVSKKNFGPPEGRIFLRHGANGQFERVEPLAEERHAQNIAHDAYALRDVINARADNGEPPLARSNAGTELVDTTTGKAWGKTRTFNAVQHGLDAGLFREEKKKPGKGMVLLPLITTAAGEGEDDV